MPWAAEPIAYGRDGHFRSTFQTGAEIRKLSVPVLLAHCNALFLGNVWIIDELSVYDFAKAFRAIKYILSLFSIKQKIMLVINKL